MKHSKVTIGGSGDTHVPGGELTLKKVRNNAI